MTRLLYELKNCSYSYVENLDPAAPPTQHEKSFQVLKDLNLQIQAGEYIAIMGASGSGKTTLMNLLGLLATPTSGELKLPTFSDPLASLTCYQNLGELIDSSQLDENEKAKLRGSSIGFVFQHFALLPRMNIIDNILLPYHFVVTRTNSQTKMSWAEAAQQARTLMERMGIAGLENRLPAQLSGGQKQRAAICRALLLQPKVLLADEPTGALDSSTAKQILDLLESFVAEGLSLIVITHDSQVASRAERIIHFKDGTVISDRSSPDAETRLSKDPNRLPVSVRSSFNPELTEDKEKPTAVCAKKAHKVTLTRSLGAGSGWTRSSHSTGSTKLAETLQPILQNLKTAFANLLSNKLRSTLTGLGLTMGVTSIILISGLGILAQNVFNALFYNPGTSKVYIYFDRDKSTLSGVRYWKGISLQKEFGQFSERFEKYARIRPFISTSMCNVQSASQPARAVLSGVFDQAEFDEMETPLSSGRFPNSIEASEGSRVAILGSDTVDAFFKHDDVARSKATFPIGEKLSITGCEINMQLTVLGVLGKRDTTFGNRDVNDRIYVPAQTLLNSMNSRTAFFFSALPHSGVDPRWLADSLTNYLAMRAAPGTSFGAGVPAELIERVRFFLFVIQALTGFIGALCILVGGIGIMNIMMVTVTERVREIGIMKSQGASPNQIRNLFIVECVTLCLIAGAAGIFVGLVITNSVSLLVAQFFPKAGTYQFIVSEWGIALGILVSFVSGIGFGYFPALKASRMEPAACMRED